jgi:hypothetical protein
MWYEHIAAIAVTVISGALLAVGLGMIAVGNRSRKSQQDIETIQARCARRASLEGRVVALETMAEHRRLTILSALEENAEAHERLFGRIDALDTKMHAHVERLEENLLTEIRRVNGKID